MFDVEVLRLELPLEVRSLTGSGDLLVSALLSGRGERGGSTS